MANIDDLNLTETDSQESPIRQNQPENNDANNEEWQVVRTRQRTRTNPSSNLMFQFNMKLTKVRQGLHQLNKANFNSIDMQELTLREKLNDIQQNLANDPGNLQLQADERETYIQYRKVQQHALSFLR
ncbi:hypothetical protein RIF29_00740 [Crotalaria pallida]|uniref:Uncharacterized protein n=1 Tax=Crotalaria pallida TaxID=3830 RepID=A0AAN9IWI3_CROPI